jgi:hypothetical protein
LVLGSGTIKEPLNRGELRVEQEIIFMVEEAPEGGYTAYALGHSIFTEGEDLHELRNNVREAVRCHFEEENMPRVVRLHIVKDEVMAV